MRLSGLLGIDTVWITVSIYIVFKPFINHDFLYLKLYLFHFFSLSKSILPLSLFTILKEIISLIINILRFISFISLFQKSILSLSLFTILKERILFLKPIFGPSVFTCRFQHTFFYHIIQLFPQFLITNPISYSLLNIP